MKKKFGMLISLLLICFFSQDVIAGSCEITTRMYFKSGKVKEIPNRKFQVKSETECNAKADHFETIFDPKAVSHVKADRIYTPDIEKPSSVVDSSSATMQSSKVEVENDRSVERMLVPDEKRITFDQLFPKTVELMNNYWNKNHVYTYDFANLFKDQLIDSRTEGFYLLAILPSCAKKHAVSNSMGSISNQQKIQSKMEKLNIDKNIKLAFETFLKSLNNNSTLNSEECPDVSEDFRFFGVNWDLKTNMVHYFSLKKSGIEEVSTKRFPDVVAEALVNSQKSNSWKKFVTNPKPLLFILAGLYALVFGRMTLTPRRKLQGKQARIFGILTLISCVSVNHLISDYFSLLLIKSGLYEKFASIRYINQIWNFLSLCLMILFLIFLFNICKKFISGPEIEKNPWSN